MARKNKGKKEQRKTVYIIGEGITEQYYFQHLKRLKGYNCIVQPRLFGNTSIFDIEKKITHTKGNLPDACRRAAQLQGGHSYTNVYKAIEKLNTTY